MRTTPRRNKTGMNNQVRQRQVFITPPPGCPALTLSHPPITFPNMDHHGDQSNKFPQSFFRRVEMLSNQPVGLATPPDSQIN